MSYLSEMEWSTKWDWESLAVYGSKAIESPKKLHLAELMMADDGETEAGSFNVSGNGNISGVSGSDGGFQGSSGKSSVSASTDSSTKDGTQTPNFKFMGFEGSSFNLNKNVKLRGTEASRTSSAMEASIGSVEPVIGLKLGKRTYFENNCAGGNVKSTSLSVVPSPCAVTQKKTKSSGKSANIPRCQVEECNLDLSMAKEYHQKHRVCDVHSKSPKVVIGGHERRFCQQCSRFHSLLEFDEKKRSCRRRLSDHNARRRKPHQETMQFSSTTLSSPFYGGRQQLNFLLNDSPLTHSVTPANSTWDISSCNSKFTLTKDYHFKCNNNGGTHEQLHMSGVKLPPVTIMHSNFANGLLASKSFKSEVLSPGSKGTLISSSHLDAAAPTYRRALSLLSNNSWGGSCAPDSVPVQHHHPILHEKDTTSCITHHQPMMNSAIPEGDPLSCSGLWPPSTGHHLTHPHPRLHSFAQNGNFQEIQLLETPYEADFYSNILN